MNAGDTNSRKSRIRPDVFVEADAASGCTADTRPDTPPEAPNRDDGAADVPPTVREASPHMTAGVPQNGSSTSFVNKPRPVSGVTAPNAPARTAATVFEPPMPPTNAGIPDAVGRGLPPNPAPGLSGWAESPQAEQSVPDSSWPRIKGFELVKMLGSAGQGDVFLARDVELQSDVAIKVPKSLNTEAREQFVNEARALARVRHRNIVGIRSYGCEGDKVYFVMDVVRGPDAAALVRIFRDAKAHRLDADKVLQLAGVDPVLQSPELRRAASQSQPYYRLVATWMAEAAEGLYAAHRANIYHRDVKPSNLLLERDGRMMVSDFGLARSSEEVSRSGSLGVTGTYPYIPPERALGEWARVDHRADIWALGATLYEFLAYQRAYTRGGKEVLKDIVGKDPVPPRNVVGATPTALEAICLKAMHRDPDSRYPTAAEMAADLRNWAVGRKPKPIGLYAMFGIAAVVLGVGGILYASPEARVMGERWYKALIAGNDSQNPTPAPRIAEDPHKQVTNQPESESKKDSEDDPSKDAPPQNQAVESDRSEEPTTTQPGARELPATNVTVDSTQPGMPIDVTPPPPSSPRVFLAFNEDLNAAPEDATPPRAGGAVQRRLEAILRESEIELVHPISSPEYWIEEDAITSAAASGANLVVIGEVEAAPVETRMLSSGVQQQMWNVRIRVRLLEIRSEFGREIVEKVLLNREYSPDKPVSRRPERAYGGDLMKHANEAGADVLEALEAMKVAQ